MPSLLAFVSRRPRADSGPWVAPENLNVSPGLLGRPLARPGRRALAMLVDLCAIALVAALANGWMLAGLALAAWQQWRPARSASRRRLLYGLAAFLLAWGLWQLWSEGPRRAHRVPSSEAARALSEDDIAHVRDAAASAIAEAGVERAAPEANVANAVSLQVLTRRVKKLERELAQANQPAPLRWRDQFVRWLDDIGLGYGWAMLYFTLLPARWGGQTLGKRLLGLRVVELTGKPMTPVLAFKRFGGYAAGMATGGLGLAQLMWDSNRQAIQDKTAHTVVIDLRRPLKEEAVQEVPPENVPAETPLSSSPEKK